MAEISRAAYADMYGPTTGDKVRLADTELWIQVEKDFTTYGDEVKFGGGKVIRDGMGQGRRGEEGVVMGGRALKSGVARRAEVAWREGGVGGDDKGMDEGREVEVGIDKRDERRGK